MNFSKKDDIIALTALWEGERFEDGRPKVPAKILERMRKITLEEAWGPMWREGYQFQFEGDFKLSHDPNHKMVGRAITAVMVPFRPDLNEASMKQGHEVEGRKGSYNQWVIDSLVEDDVVVVDLFDKIYKGTYIGGNLGTAIGARTKRGGSVIWGGIRDLEQVVEIEGIQTYYRGVDPTGIGDVIMSSMNGATRIGKAICLPGDVVLGTRSGVIFIPPHLAEKVVIGAEKSHVRDIFGFIRLEEKVYSTAQIDAGWSGAMMEDFLGWIKVAPEATDYQHLTWEEELEQAKKRDLDKAAKSDVRL